MIRKLLLFTSILLSYGCSQFSSSPTSRAWHNMNTKYNALLLSEEALQRAEYLFDSIRVDDYSEILPIFNPIDTIETAIASQELDDIIKYTSLIAERHSNSRFLDRAYVLLGIARFYKGDYVNANEVFKYVNSNGTKINDKHEALLWLMRSFMETKNYRDADDVAKILEKEVLSDDNRALLFEQRAFYNQKLEQYPLAVAYLDENINLLKKSTHKARNLFIAGQLYESLGKPKEARKNWLQVAKNKPNYNLEFNTQIELLMTNSLMGSDVNFTKLLEDRKNQDLKDKIYFKKAEANLRQQRYEAAINDFRQSASLAPNKTLKSSAYVNIAEIYYNHLSNYKLASSYYDSALVNLNAKSLQYDEIKQKAESLSAFITYSNVISREDSLQALAQMNPLELDNMVEEMLKEEAARAKQLEEEAKRIAAKKATEARNSSFLSGDLWVMYDDIALSRSRSQFLKVWGNRPLEDNWRRKEKEAGEISFRLEKGIANEEEGIDEEAELAVQLAKEKADLENKKRQLLLAVPRDPRSLAQSKRKQEEAYYQLGKIYKLQFGEPENSKKMFTTLLNKFPETVYEQEVLYFLSLLSDNPRNNAYRDQLLKKHPFSSYARQLKRGDVEITADTESNAEKVYADLYNRFKSGEHSSQLLKASEDALINFTGTNTEDKIALLRIMILSKSGNINPYRIALIDFKQSYPSSNLTPIVNRLLVTLEKSK